MSMCGVAVVAVCVCVCVPGWVNGCIVAANRTQTLIPPLVSAGAYWGYSDGSLRILQLDTLKVCSQASSLSMRIC